MALIGKKQGVAGFAVYEERFNFSWRGRVKLDDGVDCDAGHKTMETPESAGASLPTFSHGEPNMLDVR